MKGTEAMKWIRNAAAFGIVLVAGLFLWELAVRIPALGRLVSPPPAADPAGFVIGASPFVYGGPTRYEIKPHAHRRVRVAGGLEFTEKANSEGFRGPDLPA